MKLNTRFTTGVIVLSILIILIWILVLESNVSKRVKRMVTLGVTISPIPPFP